MITLERFLKYGELGPVRVGMGADEVMDVIGPPDGRPSGKNPRILKYGGLQLVVTRGGERSAERVAAVGLYYRPVEEPLPDAVRPGDWQPSAATTEGGFRAYLDRIGFPPHSSVGGEGGQYLVLPSGARVTFADGGLHCIQYTLRESPVRQVSIPLPDAAYLTIRDLARGANRSVAELCAEWVTEKANALVPSGGVSHAG